MSYTFHWLLYFSIFFLTNNISITYWDWPNIRRKQRCCKMTENDYGWSKSQQNRLVPWKTGHHRREQHISTSRWWKFMLLKCWYTHWLVEQALAGADKDSNPSKLMYASTWILNSTCVGSNINLVLLKYQFINRFLYYLNHPVDLVITLDSFIYSRKD